MKGCGGFALVGCTMSVLPYAFFAATFGLSFGALYAATLRHRMA
jgi:hypothetical protein